LVRLVTTARTALVPDDGVHLPAARAQTTVYETHVVVVVRVLAERLPVDRVRLVEVTVETREVLEPVAVVTLGEGRDPFTERRCLVRQPPAHELVPRHLSPHPHQ